MSDDRDILQRDAQRWLRLIVSGAATTADAEALKQWRQQSPAHQAAFAEAARLWKDLETSGNAFIAARGAPVWSGRRATMTRRMVLGGAAGMAASAAAYGIVRPPLDLWPSLDELKADVRTATGEQKRLSIADVAIQMNTQTSIAISPSAGQVQSIRLVAGEASFAISDQASQQLAVLAGDGRTVATRARFDVRRMASFTSVTCLAGKLVVECGGGAVPVGAGQQLVYDQNGAHPIIGIDPQEVASWQDGFIVFRATPLVAAVTEINRYRPGRVVIVNTALAQRVISGRFRIERVDEILGWIERATGAQSRSLPGGLVLLS